MQEVTNHKNNSTIIHLYVVCTQRSIRKLHTLLAVDRKLNGTETAINKRAKPYNEVTYQYSIERNLVWQLLCTLKEELFEINVR